MATHVAFRLPVDKVVVVHSVRGDPLLHSSRVDESCAVGNGWTSLEEKFTERHRSAALIAIFSLCGNPLNNECTHRAHLTAGARTITLWACLPQGESVRLGTSSSEGHAQQVVTNFGNDSFEVFFFFTQIHCVLSISKLSENILKPKPNSLVAVLIQIKHAHNFFYLCFVILTSCQKNYLLSVTVM